MGTKVAIDIGGTFTDLAYIDTETGALGFGKVATTPSQLERGVLDALAGASIGETTYFVHGTTQVINTLTERTGAATALITTTGFRDVLEIGRANRPDMYRIRTQSQEPFVPRRHRFEVDERMGVDGTVVEALDEGSVRAAAAAINEAGVAAVAICLLHAYRNPAHERRVEELVQELCPGVAISASHRLSGQWREYERTSTAVLDAYVKPRIRAYLEALEGDLEQIGVRRETQHLMLSNGGVARFAFGREQPIHLVESGPVGGIIGAAELGRLTGRTELITLDIGGTTAKSSLIRGGLVGHSPDYRIAQTPSTAGYPIIAPVVDIVEIGAGGGSIAWLDEGGALRVGPRSAGAEPGPAAYGRGGTQPTVCDANVVCGRIDPDFFLGGNLRLDRSLAEQAFAPLAERLGCTVEEAALGVLQVVNANMTNLLRVVSVQRGYDPRDFALLACGGGGGLHATSLAGALQIPEVVVPAAASQFSALGMLAADLRHDLVQTHPMALDELEGSAYDLVRGELVEQVLAHFADEGVGAGDVALLLSADLRYAGQEHTLRVELPSDPFSPSTREEIAARLHAAHEQAFSMRLDNPIELVNLHVAGVAATEKAHFPEIPAASSADPAPHGRRRVHFGALGVAQAEIYRRDQLGAGARIAGPAVVEELGSTTLIPPGWRAEIDAVGSIVIVTEER